MEYLQYYISFMFSLLRRYLVLNLIINGIPSIRDYVMVTRDPIQSFKPYYKWNTFNTV